jgi:hypothetical protein
VTGNWEPAENARLVGRVFMPDGLTPGANFAVYVAPAFMNPPFPFPVLRVWTDGNGNFEMPLWGEGMWFVNAVKDTPMSEPRSVWVAGGYVNSSNNAVSTIFLQARLGGSRR